MANVNSPFGLRPAFHLTGGVIRPQRYRITSGYNVNIFTGDVVLLEAAQANGREIERYAASGTGETRIVGVFAGCSYRATTGAQVYSPWWDSDTTTLGSEDVTAYVYDDPFIVFEVQEDLGPGGKTSVGRLADLTLTAGSTLTGQSKVTLNSDSFTDDPVYIYDWVDRADNDPASAYAKFLVVFNKHAYRNAGAASYTEQAS